MVMDIISIKNELCKLNRTGGFVGAEKTAPNK